MSAAEETKSIEELAASLPDVLRGASVRTVERARYLRQAKLLALSREVARIRMLDGDRSPRHEEMRALLEKRRRLVERIFPETQSLRNARSAAAEVQCVVRGRLLTHRGESPLGLRVQVLGEPGRILAQSDVNERGYYSVSFAFEEAALSIPLLGRARRDKMREAAKSPSLAEPGREPAASIFVQVVDDLQRVRYRDEKPRTLLRREVIYMDIRLDTEVG